MLLAITPVTTDAQRETVTVEQRITLSEQLTPAAARRRALEEAMAEAVRQVVGVRVRSTALSTTSETGAALTSEYRSVVQLDAAGRAVDVRPVREGWETVGDLVRFQGTWAITVEREVGVPDPAFTVELSLPMASLRAPSEDVRRNDELVATVTSSRAAILLLASIIEDSVVVLAPSRWTGPVQLAAGIAAEVPDASWRARGLRFRVTRPPDASARSGTLVAVALADSAIPPFRGTSLLEFQRWLVGVPLDRRALAFATYTVLPR